MAEGIKGLAFLNKLKEIGDKIENVATTVGTGVVNVAKDVKGATIDKAIDKILVSLKLGLRVPGGLPACPPTRPEAQGLLTCMPYPQDSDLDKLRSVNEFAKSQNPVVARKKFSEQELDAADKRADAILEKFHSGYFDNDFDPVRHELSQLTDEAGQDEIDQIVDRLATGVEVGFLG